jgi:hypothetical protein
MLLQSHLEILLSKGAKPIIRSKNNKNNKKNNNNIITISTPKKSQTFALALKHHSLLSIELLRLRAGNGLIGLRRQTK